MAVRTGLPNQWYQKLNNHPREERGFPGSQFLARPEMFVELRKSTNEGTDR